MSATVHNLPSYRMSRQQDLLMSQRITTDAERERYARPVSDLETAWMLMDEAEAIVQELPKQLVLRLTRACRLRLKEL